MAKDNGNATLLEGTVERIVYRNSDNGWTVLRLTVDESPLIKTVVGSFQDVASGERVRFSGQWIITAKHGKQFKAETCLPIAPATLVGIEKFLGSGLISGIGAVMAKRIVAKFGMNALEIIESSPTKLSKVDGIGPKRANAISKAMVEKRDVKEVMIFLESIGISPAFATRIHKRYGNKAIKIVSENPYRLASDVHGVGFLSADKVAAHLGVSKDSPHRAEAGLLYALEEFASEGNVFAILEDLLPRAQSLLDIEQDKLEFAVNRLVLMGGVRQDGKGSDSAIYLPRLYLAEKEAAKDLTRILKNNEKKLSITFSQAVARAEKLSKIKLASQQKEALGIITTAKIVVLTGGPGTGKTTLLKGIVACLADQKLSIAMAAPTGRAAKRMAESTGNDARTIHRLLEFTPRRNSFERNQDHPIDQDVVIIDEVSMVDIELFAALLCAVKSSSRLILVGDPDQLPSVGPGTVLSDLISLSKIGGDKFKVVRLTEIFRQARSSFIITGAHDILHGREPVFGDKGSSSDLFLIERDDPEDCLSVIKEMVAKRIPSKFKFDPITEIQVLTPMHKGIIGTSNLNAQLQSLLNPREDGLEFRGTNFKVDDKVMQIRNNYDLDVFNGDIGKITAVGDTKEWLEINYTDRTVRYPASELDQVTLAYACSIHKSQGSEYPAVVIPVHTQHFVMLQRNLLYTGITRGKKLVVLVGSKRAMRIAVKNDGIARRYSCLADKIKTAIDY